MKQKKSNASAQEVKMEVIKSNKLEKAANERQQHPIVATEVGRYIDFKTDYGFRLLLSEPGCEKRLQSLINALSKNSSKAGQLHYDHTALLGVLNLNADLKNSIICKDNLKKNYIVKMYNSIGDLAIDLTISHATVSKANTATDPQYPDEGKLTMLCFLNGDMHGDESCYISEIELKEMESNKILSSDIQKIVIELNNFTKRLDELVTQEDMWLYLIRNLSTLKEMPKQFDNDLFRPIFEDAEISNLNSVEQAMYRHELKMATRHYINPGNTQVSSKEKEEKADAFDEEAIKKMAEKSWEKHIGSMRNQTDEYAMAFKKGYIKGFIKGFKKGYKQGKLKVQRETITNLLQLTDESFEMIATLANVPLTMVIEIGKSLEK